MSTITEPLSNAPAGSVSNRYASRRRHQYRDNVYFKDGFLVTGILSLLLFMILAVSLDAANYVDDMTILVPVTLGAFALGILMSFSRFDGFFAFSSSLFSGLAWILFLMTALVGQSNIETITPKGVSELQAKSYFVLIEWMEWIGAALNGSASEDNFVYIFEMSFLIWWLTFTGIWSIFRYGYTWRAVVPAGVVLVLNTQFASQPVLGFMMLFSMVVLVLLVRTNLSEQQLRWREQRTYFSPDISFDFMRNALIYSVMVLAIAWILPGLGQIPQVQGALRPLDVVWDGVVQEVYELYPGLNPSQRGGVATFGQSLPLGGARNAGEGPVFQVDGLSGRYWRAATFDTYTGRGWLNTGQESASYEAAETIPSEEWLMRRPLTYTITLMSDSGGVIVGPPDIRQASIPIQALIQPTGDEEADGPAELSLASSRRATDVGDSYTVVSNYTDVTVLALNSASTDYPALIQERYLQLPPDFSPRVAAEAALLTTGYDTVYAKTKAIEAHLRTIPYNDKIDAPAADEDPVEYFLYDIQEGYCDYYATSMAVMLRSLGIPARTASGYAEGSKDPESGITTVTEADAHTWVEVFFPEYGWIEFEPTAQESNLERPNGEEMDDSGLIPGRPEDRPNGAQSEAASYEDEFSDYGGNMPEDVPSFSDSGQSDRAWPLWVWAVLTPVVLILGLLLISRTKRFGPSAFTPHLSPILYERMQGWANRLGISVAQADTPYEQAGRLSRALPEGKLYIDEITEAYVQYSFGDTVSNHGRNTVSNNDTDESPKEEVAGFDIAGSDDPNVADAWRNLRRLFWKEWIRGLLHLPSKRKQDPYALTEH